jgi:hypothetical protein
MFFAQYKDTTLHSHPEQYFELCVRVRLLSLMVAMIVSTSVDNNMHLLAVFANLFMTLTFITVLHRFLYSEAEDSCAMDNELCVVTQRKTAS